MKQENLDGLAQVSYRKSSRSNATGNCVEVGFGPGLVGARDSKLGESSPVVAVRTDVWTAFVAALQGGAFDR